MQGAFPFNTPTSQRNSLLSQTSPSVSSFNQSTVQVRRQAQSVDTDEQIDTMVNALCFSGNNKVLLKSINEEELNEMMDLQSSSGTMVIPVNAALMSSLTAKTEKEESLSDSFALKFSTSTKEANLPKSLPSLLRKRKRPNQINELIVGVFESPFTTDASGRTPEQILDDAVSQMQDLIAGKIEQLEMDNESRSQLLIEDQVELLKTQPYWLTKDWAQWRRVLAVFFVENIHRVYKIPRVASNLINVFTGLRFGKIVKPDHIVKQCRLCFEIACDWQSTAEMHNVNVAPVRLLTPTHKEAMYSFLRDMQVTLMDQVPDLNDQAEKLQVSIVDMEHHIEQLAPAAADPL